MTVARVQRDPIRLTHIATADASEKVRAAALSSFAKRAGGAAERVLIQAVARDAGPIAVAAAARALALLAQRKALRERANVEAALVRAATRTELPLATRNAIVEELAAIAVLADPLLRIVHDLLAKVIVHVPVGGGVRLAGKAVGVLTEEQMGRVLGVLARDDFALSADRDGDAYVVYRGEPRRFAPWRVFFEALHPLPSKRQAYPHTWGRHIRGALRAPPRGLAELTATNVPGERVLVGKRGDWGRHVPLVDDLLAMGVLRRRATRIVSPGGTTTLTPPRSLVRRAVAWLTLSVRYARFAELRKRSLESDEPAVQRGFCEAIARETGIHVEFVPHAFARMLSRPSELPSAAALALPAALSQQIDAGFRDLLHYSVSIEGNRLPHVGAYAAAVLVGMIARAVAIRRAIDSDRKAIPLVVGGWGTRGKSGTERLKAGLFQGMGYEVLVKTTGCEAMFIHAIPGLRAHEVFIYRPYDKATVWEQRSLLRLGRRFGTRVFLWECMALQPDLVNLLQEQWMRDDYSTITNAYPDHEDVQGPAGVDVAHVISEFVPTGGRLFTTEDQMLPLLRERAKARGTSMRAVGDVEAALLADDVLARFPYHEHPKNIALVCALAQALGIPAAVALAEMADNVVPDLGVLKTYPRVPYAGRRLAFTNGMSANERTGALSNWVRMGFDKHDPDRDPARWIVTVVNNRADRVARSEVFARFLVQDIAAHRHVLIGTNVSGLVGFVREALSRHLADIAPSRDLAGDAAARRATAVARVRRAFAKLAIGALDAASVGRELEALALPPVPAAEVDAMLGPGAPDETAAAARRDVDARLAKDYPAEARPFVVSAIARRRAVRNVLAALDAHLETAPERVDRAFADAYRTMFEEGLVPLYDSTLTGDQVIDAVAKSAPPGAVVDVMGVQNIKGTGLEFVYRWVSLDVVERALEQARSGVRETEDAGLRVLLAHDDWGLVDAAYAQETLAALRTRVAPERAAAFDAVLARLAILVEKKRAALSAKRSRTTGDLVRDVIGKTFDYLDSTRRQSMARAVLDDLVAGRLSHAAAAVEMRAIVARAKGAWARKKTGA